MNQSLMKLSVGMIAATALLACGSDSTSPGVTAVGAYSASQWVTTGGSGQTNQLVAGSTLQITLAGNGTTSGHLHVAASGSNPAFDADMAGTWTQDGMTVEISQPADTFVRDMPFTLTANGGSSWDLVGDKTFAGTEIRITLSRLGEILRLETGRLSWEPLLSHRDQVGERCRGHENTAVRDGHAQNEDAVARALP